MGQAYSLSAASDEDGSESLYKWGKRRDKGQDMRKSRRNSLSRSPEKGEWSNRGKEDNRKDFRRSSVDEATRRRASCSSTEAENPWRGNTEQAEGRAQQRRNSEVGRSRSRGWQEGQDKERAEEDGRRESSRSEGPTSSLTAAGRPRKELPSNLLDIFSQIAQFEKEKGIKPK